MSETTTVQPHVASDAEKLNKDIGFVPLLQRLGKVFRAITDIRLAEIGLTSGQDQFLDMMPESGIISVSTMAQALCIRPSTASKMIDRMTEKGLVRRNVREGDARLTFVELTETGHAKRTEVHRIWALLQSELAGTSARADLVRMGVLAELEAHVAGRLSRLR